MRFLLILSLLASPVSAEDIFKPTGRYAVKAPVYEPVPVPVAPARPVAKVERWLVSESWCRYCPAAKAKFLASGGDESHVLTIAEAKRRHGMTVTSVPFEYTTGTAASVPTSATSISKPVARQVVRRRLPVVRTQWGTIDLETYSRNCNCPMCRGIRSLQSQYRTMSLPVEPEPTPAHQEPTPDDVIDQMLDLMRLTPDDVLADLGCGDGRILIAAVQQSGCRGIGVEIDEVMAARARQAVAAAGLKERIDIQTGDAIAFDPESHGVTAITAYLYPELLAQLEPKFRQAGVRIGASPFHHVPKLPMTEHDSVFVYRRDSK